MAQWMSLNGRVLLQLSTDMTHGLIDADAIAYRSAAAAETREWSVFPEQSSVHSVASFQYKKEAEAWASQWYTEPRFELELKPQPVEYAFSNISNIIKGIKSGLGLTSYDLYISSDSNFRDDIATIRPYKGNRANLRKPYHLKACRNFLIGQYDAIVCEGYEADDAVSMAAYADPSRIIISNDKDLNMVPGTHYDWVKEWLYSIDKEEGMRNFMMQLLIGDTVDNIQGIEGCGKVTAKQILDGASNMFCAVGAAYAASSYTDPEAALEEMARLLWMAKDEPNDWSWELMLNNG